MCSRSSGPRPSAINAVIVSSERNLIGRPERLQIVPNSCSLRKVANPSSKFLRNVSPSLAAFSPNNFVRTSIPFFADSSGMGNTSVVMSSQLCVADHQAPVNRNYRAGDVRSGGKAEAECDVRDFFRIAVSLERGAPLGENRLMLFGNRVGERGANRPGADAIDGNSFRAQIHRERARESDDAGLGNRIGAVAWSRAEAFGRRDVDDARGVGLAQMHQCGAHHPLLRSQQAGDSAIPDAIVIVVAEWSEAAEAGVVDQDVEPAEARGDVRNDALDLGRIEDVQPPAVRSTAGARDFLDHPRDARLVDIGNRDQRAFLRKQVSGRAAHPAGSAGDDHRTPLYRAIELFQWLHFTPRAERAFCLSSYHTRC